MSNYKAAVIGVGRIGMMLEHDLKRVKPATHFGLWNQHKDVDLVAVCDNDPEKLQSAVALQSDVKTYSDAKRLFEENHLDIVSISTWKDTHYEMAKLALQYPISALIIEKPISEKVSEAYEIIELAKKAGIKLFINHKRRYDPLVQEIKRKLDEGEIGEIMQVTANYVFGLKTTATHLIDVLHYFLGQVEWVCGFPNNKQSFAPADDPCVDAMLQFQNDVHVSIQSLNMKDYDCMDIVIYGRKGKLVYTDVGRRYYTIPVNVSIEHVGFTELNEYEKKSFGGFPRSNFYHLGENVIQCLKGKAAPMSNAHDSTKALEVLQSIKESSNNKSKLIVMGKTTKASEESLCVA